MLNLHTFGDSHSYKGGWRSICIPGVKIYTHPINGKLMYSFGRDGVACLNIHDLKYNINNGDIVCFCFGEIDCRCHVYKHGPYKAQIDSLVDDYFIAIFNNVSQLEGLQVWVYNVVPPVKKDNTKEDKNYPFLGTDEERQKYVVYMNKMLAKKCGEYGYTFMDIYDKYICNDGFLNKELSDKSVHISNPKFLIEFIKNILKLEKDIGDKK